MRVDADASRRLPRSVPPLMDAARVPRDHAARRRGRVAECDCSRGGSQTLSTSRGRRETPGFGAGHGGAGVQPGRSNAGPAPRRQNPGRAADWRGRRARGARRTAGAGGGKGKLNFSFRTFIGDLISLLQESLTGFLERVTDEERTWLDEPEEILMPQEVPKRPRGRGCICRLIVLGVFREF